MELLPSVPSVRGSAELFSGTVFLDMVFEGNAMSRMRVSFTRFLPGSRTAWHSHALGQVLHITDGVGLVQSRGAQVLEVHAGDTVYTPPGEWHWHGATPDRFMTHLASWVAPADESDPETTWAEHVTDEEYTAYPRASTRVHPSSGTSGLLGIRGLRWGTSRLRDASAVVGDDLAVQWLR